LEGQHVKPKDLINGENIKRTKNHVRTHTLITDTGEPVDIQGVQVTTWTMAKWKNALKIHTKQNGAE